MTLVFLLAAATFGCGKDDKKSTPAPTTSYLPFTEANVNYKDYVKLGEYKNITITKDIAVTEDEIFDEYIKMMDEQEFEGIKTGTVKKGDAVSIAYCGYIDGKKFAGGETEHMTVIIGFGRMIPGFEDACIGQKPGVEFDINVTFPEDYGQRDLAGKPAVFKAKINYIFPELSDATAKIATEGEYQTKDALYKFIKDGITEARENEWQQKLGNLVIEKVYKNSEILKYPDGAIETAIKGYEEKMKSQGVKDPAAYMGMSKDEYTKYVTEQAKYDMGTRLMRYRIAEVEKITVTDEEINKFAADNYSYYGFNSAEHFIEYHTREYVREIMLLDKIDQLLIQNATVIDASKK